MNFNLKNSGFMRDKIFLNDYTNIVSNCNSKCLSNYNSSTLDIKEQLCLEKCYFKTISASKQLSESYDDIFYDQE